jgi:CBS domain-containing protein/anti-sigma regulatory factor (Ser/Thr protein kinase)
MVSPDTNITKTQEMVYEMRVGDVMTRTVIVVRPTDPMSQLRGLLRGNRISGLPVVEGDRLVGIISLEDFIKWLADRAEDCPIEKRMTTQLEILCQDDPLILAVQKFEGSGLGRFPVVDRQSGALVGIVTKGNVIEGMLKRLEVDYHKEELCRYRASHIFEDIEADETTLLFEYGVKGQDFQQAGTSSSRLKRTLKRLGVRPDVVRRVAIASYEAEMNLVIFTQGGTIRARVQPGEIIVETEDAGPGIADIQKALQPGYSTAPDWVRELGFGAGMGLVNIQKSSDQFEISSEPGVGTRLKARFFANGEKHETGRGGTHTGPGGEVGPPQPG